MKSPACATHERRVLTHASRVDRVRSPMNSGIVAACSLGALGFVACLPSYYSEASPLENRPALDVEARARLAINLPRTPRLPRALRVRQPLPFATIGPPKSRPSRAPGTGGRRSSWMAGRSSWGSSWPEQSPHLDLGSASASSATGAVVVLAAGAVLGAIGAIAVDAAVLAYEPVEREAITARLAPVSLTPGIVFSERMRAMTVSGAF
jgi:hypothetical protein